MRPFRCTICLESFDTELQLQLHLLSQGHQDRARPGLQKALMTLQSLNQTMPMDVDQLPKCPDLDQNPDLGFSLSNIPEVLLERLTNPNMDVRTSNVPGIPPAISAQLLLQQLENQKSEMSPDADRKSSSNSSGSMRRISEEQSSVLKQQMDTIAPPSDEQFRQMAVEHGLPVKMVKQWYRSMRQDASPTPPDGEENADLTRSDDGSLMSKGTNDMDQFSDDECGLKIVENDDEMTGKDPAENRFLDSGSNDGTDQSNRRMRTLISPDQAEVLYREYLEVIRHSEVGG